MLCWVTPSWRRESGSIDDAHCTKFGEIRMRLSFVYRKMDTEQVLGADVAYINEGNVTQKAE